MNYSKGHLFADMIALNGRVYTMDPNQSIVEAIAIADSRIVALGNNEEVEPLIGKKTRVLDLCGKTALPGFIDAHHHYQIASRTLGLMAQCHTPPNESIDDIIRVLKEWAEKNPDDEWIIGQGCLLQDRKLKEKRFPTRNDLDKASATRPVVLRFGMHVTLLNSKALEILGITKDSQPAKGATIETDPSTGEPTGVTKDLWNFIPIPEPSEDQLEQAMERYIVNHCSANGITSIQDLPESSSAISIYQKLQNKNNGKLGMRIRFYYEIPNMIKMDELVATGMSKGFGNEYVRLGGIKIFIDGGMTSANALFYDPYVFDRNHYGKLALEQATLNKYVLQANHAGLQVLMHAAGDRATDIALEAVEKAQEQHMINDHRHRIEHMGNVNPQMPRFQKAKQIGVLPVPNMGFINSFADQLLDIVGKNRSEDGFWCNTLISEGFKIPGNSDATGTHPENTNPFFCIARAVNRRTFSGRHISPAEKITVTEAIKMYTNYSAYAGFEEDEKGSIEMNKLGDFIIVSNDPWEVPDGEIENIKTLCTVVGGEIVYSAPGFDI